GRGGDVRPEAAQLGEPDVVEHDDQQVGGILRGPGGLGPARRRLVEVTPDHAPEWLIPHWPTPHFPLGLPLVRARGAPSGLTLSGVATPAQLARPTAGPRHGWRCSPPPSRWRSTYRSRGGLPRWFTARP